MLNPLPALRHGAVGIGAVRLSAVDAVGEVRARSVARRRLKARSAISVSPP